MSILIDELQQDGKGYILVSETLELMSKATKNSPVSDVKTYLLANNIDHFMPVFFRNEYFKYEIDQSEDSYVNSTGEFWSTYKALTSELVGNEYFSIEALNEFAPVRKYDIFAYKRGYHYIAKRPINGFNKGEYVIGLDQKIENMLVEDGSIERVLIAQPEEDMPELNNAKNNNYSKLEAENEALNNRLNNAINVYKEQKNEIDKLEEQLKKFATDKELFQEKIDDLENQLTKVNTKLANVQVDTNKKEGQGDSLLILGAVMHCIQDAAQKNYTQELLTQVILDKYKNISGISEGTLKKKFPEAKKYLNQRIT